MMYKISAITGLCLSAQAAEGARFAGLNQLLGRQKSNKYLSFKFGFQAPDELTNF